MKRQIRIVAYGCLIIMNLGAMDRAASESKSPITSVINTLRTWGRQAKQALSIGDVKGFHPNGEKEAISKKINGLSNGALKSQFDKFNDDTPRAEIDSFKKVLEIANPNPSVWSKIKSSLSIKSKIKPELKIEDGRLNQV